MFVLDRVCWGTSVVDNRSFDTNLDNAEPGESWETLSGLRAARLPRFEKRTNAGPTALSSSQRMSIDTIAVPIAEQWIPILWRMDGSLDVEAFSRSWLGFLEHNDIFRTVYRRNGQSWMQEALPGGRSSLQVFDLAHLPLVDAEKAFHVALSNVLASRPSLEVGPVVVALYRLAKDVHILGGFVHHIALDAHSLSLMRRDVGASYYAALGGKPAPSLPAIQFADFAAWENDWLTEDRRDRALQEWASDLSSARELRLPWSRAPGETPDLPKVAAVELPAAIYTNITRAAREHRVTVNMLFLAVVSLVLGKTAGDRQALFATHVPGRPPGFEDVLGCFAQMRPFHLSFEDDPTFAELLLRARKAFANALDIRRPASLDFIKQREIGNVVVNFQGRVPLSDEKGGALQKLRSASGDGSSLSERGPVHAAGEDRDGVDGLQSFNGARLRAYTPQLSKPLTNEFSRDLHIAGVQNDTGLSVHVTYGDGRASQQQVGQLIENLVLMHAVACSAPHQRVSELLELI